VCIIEGSASGVVDGDLMSIVKQLAATLAIEFGLVGITRAT
jgi:hypothetical protein